MATISSDQSDHFVFVYTVKFICGVLEECRCECASVRPGIYVTEINVLNGSPKEVQVFKFVFPMVVAGAPAGREPKHVEAKAKDEIKLPPRTATMDDCCRIGELVYGAPPPAPMPLTIGFLELISRDELDVTAVYTATDLKSASISIDVEQIASKRRPARGLLPGAGAK